MSTQYLFTKDSEPQNRIHIRIKNKSPYYLISFITIPRYQKFISDRFKNKHHNPAQRLASWDP